MRLRDDLRLCVAFICIPGDTPDDYIACGTAFFVSYKDCRYVVTCRHVAEELAEIPFEFRVNKRDGKGMIGVQYDPIEHGSDWPWFLHSDPTVDIAVMQFNMSWSDDDIDGESMCIPEELFVSSDRFDHHNIGVGDLCYTVGLFKLMKGKGRILPFVHTGNIGMLPADERIPVQNWRVGKDEPATLHVEGYLLEMMSLGGLSGAPVFVRPTFDLVDMPLNDGDVGNARLAQRDPLLLGVWQGAWTGYPDKTLQQETGNFKVPVGIGTVVPIGKLVEILEMPDPVRWRAAFRERVAAAKAAKTDSSVT